MLGHILYPEELIQGLDLYLMRKTLDHVYLCSKWIKRDTIINKMILNHPIYICTQWFLIY